jgi:hypothetical protein
MSIKGLNLCDVFESGLRRVHEDSKRGDEHLPHVSHLGKCLLQTWFSRSRFEQIEPSVRKMQLLQKGRHDEEYIAYNLAVGLVQHLADWIIDSIQSNGDLTGHVDLVLLNVKTGYRLLIEIKTTEWRTGWLSPDECIAQGLPVAIGKRGKPIKLAVKPGPYKEVRDDHRLQALGYALRLPKNPDGKHVPYAIFQFDRNLNGFHQYPAPGEWFDAEDPVWRNKHDEQTKKVITQTDPELTPQALNIAVMRSDGKYIGQPVSEKECSFCPYAQCALNKNAEEAEPQEVRF